MGCAWTSPPGCVLSQHYLAPSRIGEYTAFFDARDRDWEARRLLGISDIVVLHIGRVRFEGRLTFCNNNTLVEAYAMTFVLVHSLAALITYASIGHGQFVSHHSFILNLLPSYCYFAVAGLLRGLNLVLKSSCFTNHALCNFHSFVGSASCTCG